VADSSQAEAVNELVALVKEDDDGSRRAESSIKVVSICKNNCKLVALFDTDIQIENSLILKVILLIF